MIIHYNAIADACSFGFHEKCQLEQKDAGVYVIGTWHDGNDGYTFNGSSVPRSTITSYTETSRKRYFWLHLRVYLFDAGKSSTITMVTVPS